MAEPTIPSSNAPAVHTRFGFPAMTRIHGLTGWSFLIVFLVTGGYLRWVFPEAYESDDAIRYVFRANHVYILFASLLNIMAAHTEIRTERPLYRRIGLAGSVLLLLAPPVLLAAFMLETSPAVPYRPLTLIGAFAALFGALFLDRARRERLL